MTESKRAIDSDWIDPDDAPEWTEEMWDTAQVSIGDKVIRPATGYIGPGGVVVRGRPPARARAKQQVTLRLDPDVIERFRESGPGWQARINEALRGVLGL
ncbi:BrnA antitoxin family protein [Sphingomonas abietis]|uniref:BrnA antitoxin family protein n=1 Tax=Sphingomonas abietis TaxID=3012344 RepID=A0ABY7NJA8_9SPHN|nr:BrnA antitoxin family protein [Sphingomonas abietis]WBO21611.1 BrnA antitoxin family protein [Sphingomonas abietis]